MTAASHCGNLLDHCNLIMCLELYTLNSLEQNLFFSYIHVAFRGSVQNRASRIYYHKVSNYKKWHYIKTVLLWEQPDALFLKWTDLPLFLWQLPSQELITHYHIVQRLNVSLSTHSHFDHVFDFHIYILLSPFLQFISLPLLLQYLNHILNILSPLLPSSTFFSSLFVAAALGKKNWGSVFHPLKLLRVGTVNGQGNTLLE